MSELNVTDKAITSGGTTNRSYWRMDSLPIMNSIRKLQIKSGWMQADLEEKRWRSTCLSY